MDSKDHYGTHVLENYWDKFSDLDKVVYLNPQVLKDLNHTT